MNPLIVIPTYVSTRRKENANNLLAVYDHTTPITAYGELPRLLKSLQDVDEVGQIAILVSADSNQAQAAEKVSRIALDFPSLHIMVIGSPEETLIQQRLVQLNLAGLNQEIGLTGYGPIRNLGLVLAHIMGFDSIIFLDDDVVVDDPDFMRKAVYGLGKLTRNHHPILAKTGYFLNAEGSYLSMSQNKWYNHFWQQGRHFNTWIRHAMRGPRLSRSNHVSGSCLAIHKEAFQRVAFDPWIPRGEDLDYLLNLRMYGSEIWFDNKWSVHHLPPTTKNEGLRFRQDVFRWVYEIKKIEFARSQIDLMPITAESLEPYPGPFLEPGLEKRARITAFLRSLVLPDGKTYREAARAASTEAVAYAEEHCAVYFDFQAVWPELMARIERDEVLQNVLVRSTRQRQALSSAQVQADARYEQSRQARANRKAERDLASEQVQDAVQSSDSLVQPVVDVEVVQAPRDEMLAYVAPVTNLDPGTTMEIRLNLGDLE